MTMTGFRVVLGILMALMSGRFMIAPELADELGGLSTYPQLKEGEFEPNIEHFLEKNKMRLYAMMFGLFAFMEYTKDQVCESEVVLHNEEEMKTQVVCDIEYAELTSRDGELYEVVVLVFGVNPFESGLDVPFLITIIPCQWNYPEGQIRNHDYYVVYNSAPWKNPLPAIGR